MAAPTTYAELKASFGDGGWFLANDLAARIDDFIDMFEAYANTKLRCRQMETVADLTPTSNVCTLPTDYLEYKRVVEKASIRRRLSYITEDAADRLYPTRSSGLACHFMIVGSSLTALPLSANNIELTYYAKVPALSDSATTNWLLTAHPGLYVAVCKMYAAEYVEEDEIVQKEALLVGQYIENIHALDNRAKFGNAGVTLPGVVW
jgi:hypothetical protein